MTALNTLNVLIVDDQEQTRQLMQAVLEKIGVGQVYAAADGAAAKELLAILRLDVDMIVCDWQMPNMSGHEFLQHVRRDYPDMPFMMVTARTDPESVKLALSSGVTDYIGKPFTPQTFGQKVVHLAKKAGKRAQSPTRATAMKW